MWSPYGSTRRRELSETSRLHSESYGARAHSVLGALPRARSWRVPSHTLSSGTPSLSSSSVQTSPLSQWSGPPVLARESGNDCEKLDQNRKRYQYLVTNAFRSFGVGKDLGGYFQGCSEMSILRLEVPLLCFALRPSLLLPWSTITSYQQCGHQHLNCELWQIRLGKGWVGISCSWGLGWAVG